MTASQAVLDIHLTDAEAEAALRWDAWAGLTASPKELPPKWFYDARGSELFDRITELPEYFPTRTERGLLRAHAARIAAVAAGAGVDTLVELGSGSSEKTRLLLDALSAAGAVRRYVPQDVSESALRTAVDALVGDYPDLVIHGVVGDFTRHIGLLPADGQRLLAFLGSTIGNLRPAERARFLAAVRSALQPGEYLLVGAGLVTDPAVLVAAYDDAAGVTAEFNLNVLAVLNRQLGADFDLSGFDHVARWDVEQEWIEMQLRARRDMTVWVRELELEVPFAAGEEMRTEISAKFRPAGLRAELTAAGFEPVQLWTDPDDRFALALSVAV